MTVERRLLVGLNDIRAVTLVCKTCATRLTLLPDKISDEDLIQCPSCRKPWAATASKNGLVYASALVRLIDAFAEAQKTQQDGADTSVGVLVFFELEEPKA